MNELALFAGAGGGILGGKLLGWRTVCAVEIDPFCARRLCQRQNEGHLAPFPVWDDVCTFDGIPWRGVVDVVSGGFPCQDISAAGKGAGITGKRSGLWTEFARIIGEVRPRYVLVENSPQLLTARKRWALLIQVVASLFGRVRLREVVALRSQPDALRVLGDLTEMGFDARWGVVGAHHAGAPHKRDRIWIVADANDTGQHSAQRKRQTRNDTRRGRSILADAEGERGGAGLCEAGSLLNGDQPANGGGDVADPLRDGSQRGGEKRPAPRPAGLCGGARCDEEQDLSNPEDERLLRGIGSGGEDSAERGSFDGGEAVDAGGQWWATEPGLGRVAHGVAARVDRLKAIGNGQVPAVVRLAWRVLSNVQ